MFQYFFINVKLLNNSSCNITYHYHNSVNDNSNNKTLKMWSKNLLKKTLITRNTRSSPISYLRRQAEILPVSQAIAQAIVQAVNVNPVAQTGRRNVARVIVIRVSGQEALGSEVARNGRGICVNLLLSVVAVTLPRHHVLDVGGGLGGD